MSAFQQRRSDAAEPPAPDEHARIDAVRSWLANGIHTFAVDPRRRLGGYRRARQMLAEDRRAGQTAPGGWHSLASALARHTVRGGMAELSAEERRVITLAYLEGRTNREIAAMLGVSVSTVRRRLWAALKRLDAYISRTGTWLSAILVLGAGYVLERSARLGRSANAVGSADWAHKLAATVVVGGVAAAAIGLTAVSPDSTWPGASAASGKAPAIAAMPGIAGVVFPAQVAGPGPADTLRIVVALDPSRGPDPVVKRIVQNVVTDSSLTTHGCGGNPTSAPPPVPMGSPTTHPTGAPVTHPGKGGCRV